MQGFIKIWAFLGVFYPASAFAFTGGGGGNDATPAADSVNTSEESADVEFSFNSPGYDVFGINPESYKAAAWDTHSFNMYNVDMNHFHDTLNYVLEDHRCGKEFHAPFHGRVTSGFGPRRGGYHFGIDIDLELGDPIVAAMDGVVRMAGYNRGYGNMVVIAHDGGLETLYGHMSKLEVVEGQKIKAGELIGLGGSTGRSTGPHLHLEVFVFGEQVDPLRFINPETIRPYSSEIKVDASWFDYMLDQKKIKYYEVEEGTTLDDIALLCEKSSEELARINGITVETPLEPGRKILLE